MPASFFTAEQREFAEAVSGMAYSNPFLPERVEWEQRALGPDYRPVGNVWSLRPHLADDRPELRRLSDRIAVLLDEVHPRLAPLAAMPSEQPAAAEGERQLYEDLVLYFLYDRYRKRLEATFHQAADPPPKIDYWPEFRAELAHYLEPAGCRETVAAAAHLLACFYQLRRAFHHIFESLVGASMPAARLRAAVWQSIFTHDMRRYRRSLYRSLGDVTTLVTGPSGTGKELVARAIGLSRYLPLDASTSRFAAERGGTFFPLNLTALSPTLIESELFGHCRGAFTGALADREGWFEVCPAHGAVFLDEIGEVEPAIQVKLLRVLQARTFQRLGETNDRHFAGKLIAATNRNLAEEMQAGRWRADFYYRLCSDLIVTPSLAEQLADRPDDLEVLVHHLAARIAPDEAASFTQESVAWIDQHLGRAYAWPGNIRELDQALRNLLIRRRYSPTPASAASQSASATLWPRIQAGELTADQLLTWYCKDQYQKTGSYTATAQKLALDRRTVKARVSLPDE